MHEVMCYMGWREHPKGTGEASVIVIPLDKSKENIEYALEKLLGILGITTFSEETIRFSVLELDGDAK